MYRLYCTIEPHCIKGRCVHQDRYFCPFKAICCHSLCIALHKQLHNITTKIDIQYSTFSTYLHPIHIAPTRQIPRCFVKWCYGRGGKTPAVASLFPGHGPVFVTGWEQCEKRVEGVAEVTCAILCVVALLLRSVGFEVERPIIWEAWCMWLGTIGEWAGWGGSK